MVNSLKNFFRYRFLLAELVKRGIRLRYRKSYLGLFWTLLEPILNTIVLTIVFGTLLNKGDALFPVYILSGRILFSFFSQSTTAAMKAIRNNSGMIKKVYVPKYLYPLANILSNYIISLLSLVVLIGAMLIFRVPPTWHLIEGLIPLVTTLILCYGVGLILATLNVFFRDMEYIWNVATTLIMYASAIFYKADVLLKSSHAWIIKFNPMFGIIQNFRNAILYGAPMDTKMCLYSTCFALMTVVVGTYMFHKFQDKFILYI